MSISEIIASELNVRPIQVEATIKLLDDGASVPFIARYRKEATQSLDDCQLRSLHDKLIYYRELSDRKETILNSIESQGLLTPSLKLKINECMSKTTLEDLYLPFKPKRRTKAQIAKEAGLEPLANKLLSQKDKTPEALAEDYLNAEHSINSIKEALDGAKAIIMEHFSEQAELLSELREYAWNHMSLTSQVQADKEGSGEKFKDYYEFSEAIHKVPSHRALAMFRGRKEGILTLKLKFENTQEEQHCIDAIGKFFAIKTDDNAAGMFLKQAVEWTWKIKLSLKIELDLFNRLREQAELEAIKVFQENLKHLLMAAPAGNKVIMGLDPGLRTGVKLVVVSKTGKLLAYETIFPHAPKNQHAQSIASIKEYAIKFEVDLISIGNGTASRETEKLVAKVIENMPDRTIKKIVVSEAGASVYSASELAAKEFPDLDVSYRGAVSIARRLQDPLAELVKIDPKAIGVGQYQHDVNQVKLSKSLNAVLEDCVNAVGANINTASVKLLSSISGLNDRLSKNIVEYRETVGPFKTREELKNVPQMGEKTYEQAIGFLRIIDGSNPLDASAVHPESYPVVEKILTEKKCILKNLLGNNEIILKLNPFDYVTEEFGLPTIRDILSELQKPGRDPRPEFKMAQFKEGIKELKDVRKGMKLEGTVSNVTNFGAFVDVGVHQDGLVHVSELANRFVKNPNEIVKVGEIVTVTVLEVDIKRKRLQLTMKSPLGSETKVNEEKCKPKSEPPPANKIHSKLSDALTRALNK